MKFSIAAIATMAVAANSQSLAQASNSSAAVTKKPCVTQAFSATVFKAVDKNKDGMISFKEVVKGLHAMIKSKQLPKVSDKQWMHMIKLAKVARGKDLFLNKAEFHTFVVRIGDYLKLCKKPTVTKKVVAAVTRRVTLAKKALAKAKKEAKKVLKKVASKKAAVKKSVKKAVAKKTATKKIVKKAAAKKTATKKVVKKAAATKVAAKKAEKFMDALNADDNDDAAYEKKARAHEKRMRSLRSQRHRAKRAYRHSKAAKARALRARNAAAIALTVATNHDRNARKQLAGKIQELKRNRIAAAAAKKTQEQRAKDEGAQARAVRNARTRLVKDQHASKVARKQHQAASYQVARSVRDEHAMKARVAHMAKMKKSADARHIKASNHYKDANIKYNRSLKTVLHYFKALRAERQKGMEFGY